jgi:hypothetical protein
MSGKFTPLYVVCSQCPGVWSQQTHLTNQPSPRLRSNRPAIEGRTVPTNFPMREQPVTLIAARAVEIATGITLPPGHYRCKTIGRYVKGQVQWEAPEYLLVLTEAQIVTMGGTPKPNVVSAEFDVTALVGRGELRVA